MGRDLQRPLTPRELEQLAGFLARSQGAMPLPRARGFLTAVASAPTMIPPSVWQQRLLGEPEFENMAEVQRVFGLVMRLYNQGITALEKGRPVVPLDADGPEAQALWCRGYIEATRLDDAWGDDEYASALLLPFAVLSGEFDLVGEEDAEGNPIVDPTPHLERFRAQLGSGTSEIYHYWLAKRRAPPVQKAPEVGRNDPCACGSGKKYKKCCALTLH